MENMDPAEWASDLREAKDLCLDDFEPFVNELQKLYRDKERRLNSAMEAMQEYEQLPNAAVRVYANRLKANWRRAGWNQITHEVIIYGMARAGVPHALKTNVRPRISSDKDRFDKLPQLFDCVAASVF
jgi:hypothetical protein